MMRKLCIVSLSVQLLFITNLFSMDLEGPVQDMHDVFDGTQAKVVDIIAEPLNDDSDSEDDFDAKQAQVVDIIAKLLNDDSGSKTEMLQDDTEKERLRRLINKANKSQLTPEDKKIFEKKILELFTEKSVAQLKQSVDETLSPEKNIAEATAARIDHTDQSAAAATAQPQDPANTNSIFTRPAVTISAGIVALTAIGTFAVNKIIAVRKKEQKKESAKTETQQEDAVTV